MSSNCNNATILTTLRTDVTIEAAHRKVKFDYHGAAAVTLLDTKNVRIIEMQ